MNLKQIEPEDFISFQKEIEKNHNLVDRTLNFTWFYMNARFKLTSKEFQDKFSVDGCKDGGIDCFFNEGNTYYIIQSKYHEKSQHESVDNIVFELQKIEKTIIGDNTNNRAEEFINGLRRDLNNSKNYLEIIWLTTNEVSENARDEAKTYLDEITKNRRWNINAEINFIDRYALEGVIYDIKHGYIPHTGKKCLILEPGEYMKIENGQNSIEGLICNIKVKEILSWFSNSSEIKTFLQKNVRESVGDKSPINKVIRESYKKDPKLFWYKHNGIIIFADWLEMDSQSATVSIRNPQIVNGGQTITQLFKAYDEDRNSTNPAKILARIYRLPYEDAETYKRSIDIIAALNSQNKIKSSDLHSTDPRQVMLENRIDELGLSYRYFRKRTEEGKKSGQYKITMTKLALNFYVCEYQKPDEGVIGEIESFFEVKKGYNDCFPENLIKKPLNHDSNHIVFNYIECWTLSYILKRKLPYELNKKQNEQFKYIMWYLLVDVYQQLKNWKENNYSGSGREWIEFIDRPEFSNAIIKYSKSRYNAYMAFLPKREIEPRQFYKSTTAREKFKKNSGKILEFKKNINKSFKIFKKYSN